MTPDDFRRLAAAGLNTEQIAIVMEMMERDSKALLDAEEARRTKARDRVAKWRERHGNVSETLPKVTERLTRAVEDKTLTSVIEPQESKKQNAASGDLAQFKAKLAPLLDAPLLDAFVKVRKAKRAAFTELAAGLFIGDAEKCGMSVAEAATECVRSNWITVKPEYFQHRQRAGPATPKQNLGLATIDALLEKVNAVTTDETSGNPPHSGVVAIEDHRERRWASG